jgi:hypothetical protein
MTGNVPQKWEFFHVMDSFMQKKPEVTPVAVCSSTTGMHVNAGKIVTYTGDPELADQT